MARLSNECKGSGEKWQIQAERWLTLADKGEILSYKNVFKKRRATLLLPATAKRLIDLHQRKKFVGLSLRKIELRGKFVCFVG